MPEKVAARKMREDKWMYQKLYDEATQAPVLSRQIIDTLLNSMEYSSISFINWSIDVLKILKTRIDRGDKITDAVSKIVYDKKSFQAFVKKNFSSYIFSQVYADPKKAEKVYAVTVVPEYWERARAVMQYLMAHLGGFFCGDTEDFKPEISKEG